MKFLKTAAFFLVLLGFVAGLGYSQVHPASVPKAGDLITGGGNPKGALDVGDLFIWRQCDKIYVEYVIVDGTPLDYTDNWLITAAHVEIALSLAGIPQSRGNPVPGLFTYSTPPDFIAANHYTQTIPLNGFMGNVYVAAHAVVCQGGLRVLPQALPTDPFNLTVTYYVPDKNAYFPTVEITNDTWLDGIHYNGWCVDVGHNIVPGELYSAMAYSSYDPALPAGIVDKPENLDLVNWVLNNIFVGQEAFDESGLVFLGFYTWEDIQRAIWQLIDTDVPEFPDLPGADIFRVYRIIALATEHDGYIPGCGESVAILLSVFVESGRAQTVLITIPVPCAGGCKTSWAAIPFNGGWGYPFPGRNWATYLLLTIPYVECPPLAMIK